MSERKIVPTDDLPEFGSSQYEGITLEVLMDGRWETFQPFYFDIMTDRERKYYIKNMDDLKGYEIMGKVWLSTNSDVILRATHDMLRAKSS
jgi:hypothetical protein